MLYAVNYANEKFRKAQKLNTKTAYSVGMVDKVFEFGPEDIDVEFRERNKTILEMPRGNGYWLWKPYFIDRVLSKMKKDDWLIYADSGGLFYLNSLKKYIKILERKNIDAVCQTVPSMMEAHYTKRDTFVLMGGGGYERICGQCPERGDRYCFKEK